VILGSRCRRILRAQVGRASGRGRQRLPQRRRSHSASSVDEPHAALLADEVPLIHEPVGRLVEGLAGQPVLRGPHVREDAAP
jgi:hypothetical protein